MPSADPQPATESGAPGQNPAPSAAIVRTVTTILEYAVKNGASDIHLEPRASFVQVRYRIDGLLQEAMTLPLPLLPQVISQLKTMAGLKTDEQHLPQEGQWHAAVGDQMITLHISILPVVDGEKVVISLLPETMRALTLPELGLEGNGLAAVSAALRRPHGLILVTGPVGAGKSTILYSLLTILNLPGVNISTIEDPVEYRLTGVNQTPVNHKTGVGFAAGLQALLDQDPDIIMVGELADKETAELATQTASERDLVLSTLPTSPAAAAPLRLIDLGVEPFLVASTITVVIDQRLVRRLCPHCKTAYIPEGEELERIKQTYDLEAGLAAYHHLTTAAAGPDSPAQPSSQRGERIIQPAKEITMLSILDRIAADPDIINRSAEEARQAAQAPADKPSAPTSTALEPNQFLLYRVGDGCEQCNQGYKGRIGLYEVLENDDIISKMIAARASLGDIQGAAVRAGMLSLAQDGLVKALEGITTLEEVARVARE